MKEQIILPGDVVQLTNPLGAVSWMRVQFCEHYGAYNNWPERAKRFFAETTSQIFVNWAGGPLKASTVYPDTLSVCSDAPMADTPSIQVMGGHIPHESYTKVRL